MQEFFAWFIDALASRNWSKIIPALAEIIRTTAPVFTVLIAYQALKNWKRQDKAKRESEFLDSLIEAAHTFIAEMPKPVVLLQIAKIGMDSHTRSWEEGDEDEKAIAGAIAYIEKNGELDGKRLLDCLEEVRPSVIKLRSLVAKGQVFCFENYTSCQDSVAFLTWNFDRIEAFTGFIRSPSWNWQNPEVRVRLKDAMRLDPDEIRKSIEDNNVTLLTFAGKTYSRIYG
ncbi:hypothetical protein [Stappia indica]|uniref:hypothetical protein n=1 Tax=Stappia indica TaxID=538381 RepID=UPI001112C74C|nr:hypothetical protein [Stappia indica]